MSTKLHGFKPRAFMPVRVHSWFKSMPFSVTATERRILSVLAAMIVLGFIGYAVL